MRFVFMFIVALAIGHAHADGPGGDWEQVEQQQEIPQGYDEYWLDNDGQQVQGGNVTIVEQQNNVNVTIVDNSVTINNYVMIDTNRFPDAPPIAGPAFNMPAPVLYCYVQPRPWGWTFYAYTFDHQSYPLAHVGDWGAFQSMRYHLWATGQCPNR